MTQPNRDPRHAFAEAAEVFGQLVRAIPPDAWDGPGLGEWNLRSLVGHTSRTLITVETYLGQPADTEAAPTPAAYYVAVAGLDPEGVGGGGKGARRKSCRDYRCLRRTRTCARRNRWQSADQHCSWRDAAGKLPGHPKLRAGGAQPRYRGGGTRH